MGRKVERDENRGDWLQRPSIADGCEEKFDFAFAKWILKDGRIKERRASYREVCMKYSDKVIICRTRKDARNLMKNLGC